MSHIQKLGLITILALSPLGTAYGEPYQKTHDPSMRRVVIEIWELALAAHTTRTTIERVIEDPSRSQEALDLIELLGRTSNRLERLGTESLGFAPRGLAAASALRSYAVTIPFILRQRLPPRQELATPP